jgi:hypothetical protein
VAGQKDNYSHKKRNSVQNLIPFASKLSGSKSFEYNEIVRDILRDIKSFDKNDTKIKFDVN